MSGTIILLDNKLLIHYLG